MNTRSILLLLLFTLLLSDLSIKAYTVNDTIRFVQPPPKKKKKPYPSQPLVLKTSPLAILGGGVIPFTSEYRLSAEITTGRVQSEQVSVGVLGKNLIWAIFELDQKNGNSETIKASGWRFQYMHKIYLVNRRHNSPYGFYVAPHLSYTNAHISYGLNRYYKNNYFEVRHFNANLVVGVQVGKLNRLTLDVCGGLGYKNNTVYHHANINRIMKYDTSDFGEYYNGHFHMMFDISIGYSY